MIHKDFHYFWDDIESKLRRVLHLLYACGKDSFVNDGVEFEFWSEFDLEFEFKFSLESVIRPIIGELFEEEMK